MSLLEGIAQGFMQGRALNQEKEEKELRKKIIKLQAQQLETEIDLQGRRQGVIDRLSQQDPLSMDGTVAAPMANAGQAPKSLAEKMANLSIGDMLSLGMNPMDVVQSQQKAKSQGVLDQLLQSFMPQQSSGVPSGSVEGSGGISGVDSSGNRTMGGLQLSGITMGADGPQLQFKSPSTAFLDEGTALGMTKDQMREIWMKKQAGMDVSQELEAVRLTQTQLQNQLQIERIEQARREREKEEKSATEENKGFINSLDTDVDRATEAADLIDDLEGTMLQTGEFSDMRKTGMGLWALADPTKKELVAKAERFNQIAVDFGVRTLEFLLSKGGITDQKFKVLMDNTLNSSNTPSANRKALVDILEEATKAANTKGIEIPRIDEVKSLIKRLKTQDTIPSGIEPELWEAMTPEERAAFK